MAELQEHGSTMCSLCYPDNVAVVFEDILTLGCLVVVLDDVPTLGLLTGLVTNSTLTWSLLNSLGFFQLNLGIWHIVSPLLFHEFFSLR